MKKLIKAKLRIYRNDCDLTNYLYQRGIKVSLIKMKPGTEHTLHLIKISNSKNKVDINSIKNIGDVLYYNKNELLVSSKSCSACASVALSNLLILSAEQEGQNSIIYTVLGDGENIKNTLDLLKSKGLKAEIVEKEEYIESDLTEKQLNAIITAYKMGYFCTNRKATLSEVAKQIGIKPSSFEDVFRRGIEKIIKYYLYEKNLIDQDFYDPC